MQYILFACGAGLFLFACVQLLSENKQPVHYCMIIGCFAADYTIFYFWAFYSGLLLHVPVLALSDLPAITIGAPAFYLAALSILYEGRRSVRNYAVYFIGPGIFAGVLTLYNLFTMPAYFKEFGTLPGHFETPLLWFVTSAAFLSMPTVIILDLLAALRLHRAAHAAHTKEFRSQVVFLFCYLVASTFLIAACVTGNEQLLAFGVMGFGLIASSFAVVFMAVFFFTKDRSKGIVPTPQPRPAWDSSAEELSTRLIILMDRYAPYKEPELTVAELAELLNEEPKRLSYYFNVSLGTNFRHYINDWRLRAVCRDLIDYPARTILEIAFADGFNSKSSFNTLFFKAYGMTPRQYRSEHAGKKASDSGQRSPVSGRGSDMDSYNIRR